MIVFLTMNSIDILEKIRMLMMIMTNLSRGFQEDVIDRRWHQVKGMMKAKGYWNHGYGTHSKSSFLFKEKWYDEEDRRKISSLSKFVRWEGPGSTVKIQHDNDVANQARNDVIGYKLISKEDY